MAILKQKANNYFWLGYFDVYLLSKIKTFKI